MNPTYTRPQLLVRQALARVPAVTTQPLGACILGPQFSLHRYYNLAERATMTGTLFADNTTGTPQIIAYEGLKSGEVVDKPFSLMYGEKLEAELWHCKPVAEDPLTPYQWRVKTVAEANKLVLTLLPAQIQVTATAVPEVPGLFTISVSLLSSPSGFYPLENHETTLVTPAGVAGSGAVVLLRVDDTGTATSVELLSPGSGYTTSFVALVNAPLSAQNISDVSNTTDPLPPELGGRPVQIGDMVYSTVAGNRVRRVVTGFEKGPVASHYGTNKETTEVDGKPVTQLIYDDKQLAPSIGNLQATTASFTSTIVPTGWTLSLGASTLVQAEVLDPGSGGASLYFPVIVSEPLAILDGATPWPTVQAAARVNLGPGNVVASVDITTLGAGYYQAGCVGVRMINQGSGYQVASPPAMTVTLAPGATVPPDHRLPTLAPIFDTGGHIIGAQVLDPGYNIPSLGNLVCTVALPPSGTRATFTILTNAGMIRGLTITKAGRGYAPGTEPTVTIGAPAAGGVLATASLSHYAAVGATIVTLGAGYKVGNILRPAAGTNAPMFRVLTINGTGGITSTEVVTSDPGTVLHTVAESVTLSGTKTDVGTGFTGTVRATFSVQWGLGAFAMTNNGFGYQTAPAVTLTAAGAVDPGTAAVSASGTSRNLLTRPTINVTSTDAVVAAKVAVKPTDWSGVLTGSSYQSHYGERYTITLRASGSPTIPAIADIVSASNMPGTFTDKSAGPTADNRPASVVLAGRGYVIKSPVLQGLSVELLPPEGTPTLVGLVFQFVVMGNYKPLVTSTESVVDPAILIDFVGSGLASATVTLQNSVSESTDTFTAIVNGGVVQSVAVAYDSVKGPYVYKYPPMLTMRAADVGSGTAPIFRTKLQDNISAGDLVLDPDGRYTGTVDTVYAILVVKGSVTSPNPAIGMQSATVTVYDSGGTETPKTFDIIPGQTYPLGTKGLSFKMPIRQGSDSGLNNGYQAISGAVTVSGGTVTAVAAPVFEGSGYPDGPVNVKIYDTTAGSSGAVVKARAINGTVVIEALTVVSGGTGFSASGAYAVIDPPPRYQMGLRTKNAYVVGAVASTSGTVSNIMVLNGLAMDTAGKDSATVLRTDVDVDMRALFSGNIDPGENGEVWEAGSAADGGLLLKPGLSIAVAGRSTPAPVRSSINGRLFASYRTLVLPPSPNVIKLYTDEDAIKAAFGAPDLDNPVSYGAVMAYRGAQGKSVWAGAVASDDVAGYQTLLTQAERIDGIYAIAPMTYDTGVQDICHAHVYKCSQAGWKLWRRTYLATASPGAWPLTTTTADGGLLQGTISNSSITSVPNYNRLICSEGQFLTTRVRTGDQIRYSLNGVVEIFIVDRVTAEDELLLVEGPGIGVPVPQTFEIWRPDNGMSQVEFVAARSTEISAGAPDGGRRAVNVWIDRPQVRINSRLTDTRVYYVAAEIAGLRSAVLPQQGLTYTELVHSVHAAPMMFTKYTQEELNIAARSGTFIVTQEVSDGPIFIRHQLTTNSNPQDGVLYFEDSVGTNLDSMSYQVRDLFQPYIGRRNANIETLEELETKFRDLLGQLMMDPPEDTHIGPALIRWTNLELGVDKVLKDKINVKVTLQLPLPINVIDVTLYATSLQDDITITVDAPEAATA